MDKCLGDLEGKLITMYHKFVQAGKDLSTTPISLILEDIEREAFVELEQNNALWNVENCAYMRGLEKARYEEYNMDKKKLE